MEIPDLKPCPEVIHLWWQWHPPVGVFIGILAVVGVLVPWFKGGVLTRGEKAFWTFLMFLFVGLEIRTLYLDRDEHDKEQALANCRQIHDVSLIVGTLTGSIKTNKDQYDSTIEHVDGVLSTTQEVAKLAEKNLENVTGGKSFGFVVPQLAGDGSPIPLRIWNEGEQVLSGVSITIAHTQDPNWGSSFYAPIYIGTIGPHSSAPVPSAYAITPKLDAKSGVDNYWIEISAQNGTVDQSLFFRPNKKNPKLWAYSYLVTKAETLKKPVKNIPKGATLMNPILRREWSDEVDVRH